MDNNNFNSHDNENKTTEAQNNNNSTFGAQNEGNNTYGNTNFGNNTYANGTQYDQPNYNNNYGGYNNQNSGYQNQYNSYNNNQNGGYYSSNPYDPLEQIKRQQQIVESANTAKTSMIFGIIALVTAIECCGVALTPLWAILAIVKGSKAQQLAFPEPPSKKAKLGKIFGIISLGITAFMWMILFFLFLIGVFTA